MRKCRKRKQTFEGELDEYYERARRRFKANDSVDEELEYRKYARISRSNYS